MSLESMTKIKALIAAGLAALLPGCSPFTAVNLLVPRSGYTVHRNLAFGTDPRQRPGVIDLRPLKKSDKKTKAH